MGITQLITTIKNLVLTDDVLANNITERSTNSVTFVFKKSIKITTAINPNASVRLKVALKCPTGAMEAVFYRNTTQISTVAMSHTGGTYTDKYQDFIFTDLAYNDTFSLYIRTLNIADTAYCQNFRVCGILSDFNNEVE